MSLFGLDWAAGTEVGEIIKAAREAQRIDRARADGAKGFYVPADLSALNPDGIGVQRGKPN